MFRIPAKIRSLIVIVALLAMSGAARADTFDAWVLGLFPPCPASVKPIYSPYPWGALMGREADLRWKRLHSLKPIPGTPCVIDDERATGTVCGKYYCRDIDGR